MMMIEMLHHIPDTIMELNCIKFIVVNNKQQEGGERFISVTTARDYWKNCFFFHSFFWWSSKKVNPILSCTPVPLTYFANLSIMLSRDDFCLIISYAGSSFRCRS